MASFTVKGQRTENRTRVTRLLTLMVPNWFVVFEMSYKRHGFTLLLVVRIISGVNNLVDRCHLSGHPLDRRHLNGQPVDRCHLSGQLADCCHLNGKPVDRCHLNGQPVDGCHLRGRRAILSSQR